MAFSLRKAIQGILNNHGLDNKFSVREVGFADLARDSAVVVEIKGWRPSPVASLIESEIKSVARANRIKAIVEF